jgi:hypothetical protein
MKGVPGDACNFGRPHLEPGLELWNSISHSFLAIYCVKQQFVVVTKLPSGASPLNNYSVPISKDN